MSLRRQFVMVLATFSVVLALVFGLVTWRIASDALEAQLDRRLVDIPGALAAAGAIQGSSALSLEPGFEDAPLYEAYQRRLDSLQNYVADAFVFRADNRTVLVSAEAIPIGDTLRVLEGFRGDINEALREGSSTTATFRGDDGRPYKYGFVRLEDTPAILGVLIPADYFEPLGRLSRVLLVASLGALAVAIVLGGLLAANIVGPLERLSRVALRIQRGHMDDEVAVERGDELGRLSRAMERMREGIVERDEQLRLMLAQVAHEIRNPLGGLELFASAAADADEPGERRRLIGRVRSEVHDLNRIIDDFLTFARPLAPDREGSDLREPLRDAAELARGELEVSGTELELRLPDEPLIAAVDRDRIKRAVLNLLRNAGQAGAGRVVLEARSRSTQVVVRVADDGPGIPPDRRERIFEPFVTDKEKGAGLGLAIVRKVVEAHGGRVEVAGDDGERLLGEGAEIRIYLIGLEEPPPGTPAFPDDEPATADGSPSRR